MAGSARIRVWFVDSKKLPDGAVLGLHQNGMRWRIA